MVSQNTEPTLLLNLESLLQKQIIFSVYFLLRDQYYNFESNIIGFLQKAKLACSVNVTNLKKADTVTTLFLLLISSYIN